MDILNTISNNRYWAKHGHLIASVLATILLLAVVAHASWSVYSGHQLKLDGYKPQGTAPLTQQTQKSYRVQDILSAHLFGNPAPIKTVQKAPKTTLNLKLQGVLWASDQQLARAIIQSGKRSTELYSVGEGIKGAGASIKEIRATEVLLNRNGATESLPLVKSKKSGERSLFTFSQNRQAANNTRVNRSVSANRAVSQQRTAATKRTARATRKRKYSGLDRALKKRDDT